MNKRNKYQIISNGLIFQIKEVAFPNLILVYIISKKVFKVSSDYFEDALKKKAIIILKAKPKQKLGYKHPEWLENYLIERNKIIDEINIKSSY